MPPNAPRRRVAIGPDRPQYFMNAENDRMFMMMAALAAEISVLRDRIDTMEALAEQGVAATSAAIEAFALPPERQAAREAARMAMLRRVYRVVTEELDAVREGAREAAPSLTDPDALAGPG
jgi:hypothetical protein